jgi:hypothetical protein
MSDSASKKTKAMLQAEVEQTAAVAAAKVRAAEERAAAERANAERITRSFEELQQRVAATEAAQRAASAQSQSTPSVTGSAGAGTESYGAQVNSLIAQLQVDQRMQYGPGAGMGPGLPAFNLAGLTGQPHGRDAAPSLGFGAAEPVHKKAQSEMSLQELVALRNGSASGGSSDCGRPMVTTRVDVRRLRGIRVQHEDDNPR